MIREPSPPPGDSNAASWARNLIQWCKQFQCNDIVGGKKVSDPSGGYHIEITPGKGGGLSGLRWADPVEFDWINGSYSRDQIVIVSPDSPAATLGTSEEATETRGTITGKDGTPNPDDAESEDIATAGIWACLKTPKVLSEVQPEEEEAPRNYDIHVPVWPPPSATDLETLNLTVVSGGEIIDHPDNYWRLIGFIPIERIWCDDDGPHPYYVQAVKAPPEPEPAP